MTSWFFTALIFFTACTYLVPKLIVVCLSIFLRKFSFYASVGGPLTLNSIMLRIPLKMNFAILIRVEQVKIQLGLPGFNYFQETKKWISLHTIGLQVNLLLRDDFDKWNDQKIELLHMIDIFYNRLDRLGLLNNKKVPEPKSEDELKAAEARLQAPISGDQKDWSQTVKNLLDATTLVANGTKVSFFVYKMDGLEEFHRNIDEVNINMFYQRCLQDKEFQRKYNCLRIYLERAEANLLRMSEDNFEIMVKSPELLFLNSKYQNQYGKLSNVDLQLKVPRELQLVKDVCNWEFNIKIDRGVFDISKGFIQRACTFFIMMDTLASVFKEITSLVYKQHFQEVMFFRAGCRRHENERRYDNYRDPDIPKKIKLQIVEKLIIDITYPSKRLDSFLPQKNMVVQLNEQDQQLWEERLRITLAPKTKFEMTFRINKTYYLQFETAYIDMEENGQEVAKIENFRDHIDFALKREQSSFQIKQCPLELSQNIQIDGLQVRFSPAFLKHILELINYYKFGISLASIKHRIFRQIQDPVFLMENIVERINPTSKQRFTTDEQLELYEGLDNYALQNLDKVSTKISVNAFSMWHSSHEIYGEVAAPSKYPNSYAADLSLDIADLKFSIAKIEQTEEMILKCSTFILSPQNRLVNQQRLQHGIPQLMPKDSRCIAKAQEICWQQFLKQRFAGQRDPMLPFSDRENYKIYNKRTFVERLHFNIDFELFLDRTRDVLDYAFILKYFVRKWRNKYQDLSVHETQPIQQSDQQANQQQQRAYRRNAVWRQVTESNTFYVPMAEIFWQLSRSRMLVFKIDELRPGGFSPQVYENIRIATLSQDCNENRHEYALSSLKKHSKTALGVTQQELVCSSLCLYHCKIDTDQFQNKSSRQIWRTMPKINSFQVPSTDATPNMILQWTQFKLNLFIKEDLTSVGLYIRQAQLIIPHDVMFGSLIHEIDKQIDHMPAWIRRCYKQKKREINFQYEGRSNQVNQLNVEEFEEGPRLRRKQKKPWQVDYSIQKCKISIQEEPLLQLFTNQDEIVEVLSQQQIFLCAQSKRFSLLSMLKDLKEKDVYRNYCELVATKLIGRIELPKRLQDAETCLKWIHPLDEARMYMKPKLFEHFDPIVHRMSADYLALHGRSIFKPVIEIWSLDFNVEQMNVALNSNLNQSLFQTEVVSRIFNRFPLASIFNKLPCRFYYKLELDMQRLNVNIQGQQTLLFFNDFTHNLEKISDLVDLSGQYDSRMRKLPVLGGTWDQLRTLRRGSAKITMKDVEVEIWPKRVFNRYTERLVITLNDFHYNKRVSHGQQKETKGPRLMHDICFRRLYINKEPSKQFESALLHFPLIELQIAFDYNQGKDLNHFKVLNAHDFEHYVRILQAYSTKELQVQVKLNMPTFGTINPTREKTLYLPLLMQSYMSHSPIPIVHYQRSHMRFIDSILQEYANGGKIDISGRVKARRKQQLSANGSLSDLRHPKLDQVQNSTVHSVFVLQVQTFLNDMMVLFTDFDGTIEEFKIHESSDINAQTIEPDNIDDDECRDEYLSNYQGIVFTTENLSLATKIIVNITTEVKKIHTEDSKFSNRFLCLSALNSQNLFQIRNKKLDHLRRLEQPKTMDNYKYFCSFFEIDPKTQKSFSALTREFKSIFPEYVLRNESIQHAILTATGGYESFFEHKRDQKDPHRMASLFADSNFQSVENDLNFRECDTIALIELAEYQQNAFIEYETGKKDQHQDFLSNASGDLIIDQARRSSAQRQSLSINQTLTLDQIRYNTLAQHHQDSEQSHGFRDTTRGTLVRHLLDIRNSRFLYTKHVYELLHRHLVKGFDYRKYRKTDYIDVEQKMARKRNFLDGYVDNKSNYWQRAADLSRANVAAAADRYNTQKEAYMALRLTNPQINVQDGVSKAQALITSEGAGTTAVFFAYSELEQAKASDVQIMIKTKEGGKWNTNIIKNELSINLDQMNMYVAPTYINLEKPTFWRPMNRQINRTNQHSSVPVAQSMRRKSNDLDDSKTQSEELDRMESNISELTDKDQSESIQALVKVLQFSQTHLKYVFKDESYCDHNNPLLDIEINLSSVNCEMDSPSMWQFLGVFKATFLDRGEKTEDQHHIEEARIKDLKRYKPDQLREMIDREVKGAMNSLLNQMKPIFSKRVTYSLEHCEFSFRNLNKKFASGKVQQARGMHHFYANKESKTDIDIEKIQMYDHLDDAGDGTIEVISPYGKRSDSTEHLESKDLLVREAMIKLRTRDKFKVVNQAPWRVFDQYEIFLYPTNIQLTREFYSTIKQFFFQKKQADSVNEPAELQDHYDVLINTRAIEKVLPSANIKKREGTQIALDNLSDNSKKMSQKKPNVPDVISTAPGTAVQVTPVKEEIIQKRTNDGEKDQLQFRSFFRYLRINEIRVNLTYIHSKSSRLNVSNMDVRLAPFIKHGKFQTLQQVLQEYESHCKKRVVAQTPNLLNQFLFKVSEQVNEVRQRDKSERSAEITLQMNKRALLGDYART